jgi:hypothetical protein
MPKAASTFFEIDSDDPCWNDGFNIVGTLPRSSATLQRWRSGSIPTLCGKLKNKKLWNQQLY